VTLVEATASWPDDPALDRDPWGLVPRANVSVKPTALTPRFDPELLFSVSSVPLCWV